MAKIRLAWPWKGQVINGKPDMDHDAGEVVNVDDDTARDLVRRGLAAYVAEDTPTGKAEGELPPPPGANKPPEGNPPSDKGAERGAGKES
jgi:hypothetical protein